MEIKIQDHYINELTASLMYTVASNKVHQMGYNGVAKYFMSLAEEEAEHSRKVVQFCSERCIPLTVKPVPQTNIPEDLEGIFKMVLGAEEFVMECLSTIYNNCTTVQDEPIRVFLVDMIKEQIGGVDEAKINLTKCKMALANNDPLGFDSYCASL